MNYKIVCVTWIDATRFSNLHKVNKKLPLRESLGYIVRDDEHAVGVCWLYDRINHETDINTDDESEGILIPRAMIKSIEYLEKT